MEVRALRLAAVALAALAFHPIIHNYFRYDDFFCLFRIVNGQALRFVFEPTGGHLLIVRNAVFWLFFQLFGTRSEYYFAAVLLTHLVNVVLLFEIIRHLTASARLACFGASLWGVSPVSEGALGWYAVYGHVLATTLALGAVWWVVRRPAGAPPFGWRAALGWWLLLLAAAASFGVGIGMALVFPAVVLLLAGRRGLQPAAWAIVLAIPLSVVAAYQLGDAYQKGLYGQQALDASAVAAMTSYWRSVGGMLLHLVGYGIASLLLGIGRLYVTYPVGPAWVAVAVFAGTVGLALAAGAAVERRHLLACALMVLGTYGVVALGRGPLYIVLGSLGADRAATVSRYHYLGPAPLSAMLCLALAWIAARPAARRLPGLALLAVWIAAAAPCAWANSATIDSFTNSRLETERVVQLMRDQIAAAPPGQAVSIKNVTFASTGFLLMADGRRFPGWVAVFEIFFPENVVDGRRVFFVTDDPGVVAEAAPGTRLASLLLPPPAPRAQ